MISLLKKRARIWLMVYLIYLAVFTLSPFEFSIRYFHERCLGGLGDLLLGFIYLDFSDMIANLILFIPFGFIYYYLSRHSLKTGSWKQCFFIGGLLSFGIEFTQLFLDRLSNGMDILMNALGSVIGFILAGFYQRFHHKCSDVFSRLDRRIHAGAVLAYGFFIVFLFLYPRNLTTPESWHPKFHLCIGNEATKNRPWLGSLHWVALYDQSLTKSQVRMLHQADFNTRAIQTRKSMGLIALYPFTEGQGDTLHDGSGYLDPLPMIGNKIEWISDQGIRCTGRLIRSESPGVKITDAVKKSGAFSIEVWCRPENLTQGGPARIVSLSPDPAQRNFTLAQQKRQIRLRFRSRLSGKNGSDINLRARGVLDSLAEYHLIATYNHGVEQLYVNGQRHADVIYGHISYLPEMMGLGTNRLAQIGFIMAFLFPLGVSVAFLFRRNRLIITIIFVLSLVLGVDLFYVYSYHAPLCIPLLVTGLISAVSGWIFIRLIVKSDK
ncbi:VanZ family protein [bacterium]|nr:VanZ family protein [bacterium]RQV98208.1 MAG: hypothetical protein EH221_02225 [bacterium]